MFKKTVSLIVISCLITFAGCSHYGHRTPSSSDGTWGNSALDQKSKEIQIINYYENHTTDLQVAYRQMDLAKQWKFKPILQKSAELMGKTRANYFFEKKELVPCSAEIEDAATANAYSNKLSILLENKNLSEDESKTLKELFKKTDELIAAKNSEYLACVKKIVKIERLDSEIDMDALKTEFNNLH